MRPFALYMTASVVAAMTVPSVAYAGSKGGPAFVTMGVLSDAPQGYVEMCARDPNFCGQLEGRDSSDVIRMLATPKQSLSPTGASLHNASWSPNSISSRLGTAFTSRILAKVRQGRSLRTVTVSPVENAPLLVVRAPEQGQVAPTPMSHKDLVKFNNMVNRAVIQRTDFEIYGVGERWSRPIGGSKPLGDCEDIAIEKRARLVEGGVDPRALSLAVVYSRFRGLHTVLVNHRTDGDFVLDSLSAKVSRWNETDYIWLRIQARDNPGNWYSVQSVRIARAPVSGYFGREDSSQGDEG